MTEGFLPSYCANLFPHNGYTPADSQAHSNHVLVANHYVARTGHCSTSHITHSQTQFWVGSETVYSVIPIAVVMHLLWSIILQIKFIFWLSQWLSQWLFQFHTFHKVPLWHTTGTLVCYILYFYLFIVYFLYFLYLYLFIYLFLQ